MKPWQAILLAPFVGVIAFILIGYLMKYSLITIGILAVWFTGIYILAPFTKSEE